MSLFSQSGITSVAADATVAVLIALLSVASFVCLVVFLCRFADDTAPVKRKSVALLAIFGAGAVVRLTFAFCIRGYRADYALFTDMFDHLKTSGLGGYYSGDASEVLYPMAYFVYLIFGGLANVTGLGDFALGTQFAVKLPLIIADLAAAYAVYLLASRYFNRRVALTLCAFVCACPVFFMGSAIWCTPIVFTACFICFACYFVARKSYAPAIAFATAAAFSSKEGIYIFPILLVFCAFHLVRALTDIRRRAKDKAQGRQSAEDNTAVRTAIVIPLAFVCALVAAYALGLFMIFDYSYNPFTYIYEFTLAPLVGWKYFTYNGLSVYAIFNQNGGAPAARFPSWVFVGVFAVIITAVVCVVYFTKRNRATLVMLAAYALFTMQVYYPGTTAIGMQSTLVVVLAAYALVKDKRLLSVLFVTGLAYVVNASATLANAGYLGNLADYYFTGADYTGSTLLSGGLGAIPVTCAVVTLLAHLYFTIIAVSVGMTGQKRMLRGANGFKASLGEYFSRGKVD